MQILKKNKNDIKKAIVNFDSYFDKDLLKIIPNDHMYSYGVVNLNEDKSSELSYEINDYCSLNEIILNNNRNDFIKQNKDKNFLVLGVAQTGVPSYFIKSKNGTYNILENSVILVDANLTNKGTLKDNLYLITVPTKIKKPSKNSEEELDLPLQQKNLSNIVKQDCYTLEKYKNCNCSFIYNYQQPKVTASGFDYFKLNLDFYFNTKRTAVNTILGHVVDIDLKQQDKFNPYDRARMISFVLDRYATKDASIEELEILNRTFENAMNLVKHETLDTFITSNSEEAFTTTLNKIAKDMPKMKLREFTDKWEHEKQKSIMEEMKEKEAKDIKERIKMKKEKQKQIKQEEKTKKEYLDKLQQQK